MRENEAVRSSCASEDGLPPFDVWKSVRKELPELAPELIGGVLRQGHKMLISGSSKAGKSFLLLELCAAISEGGEWLGFKCRQGRVLYINFEMDRASCLHRLDRIYDTLGIREKHGDDLVVWTLRGRAEPLDRFVPKLISRVRDMQFSAIVLDPIYKVITGDENSATDMGAFCNQFDRICDETGCSVICCHHHSKGAQGSKRVMDRASGSGVFARDPDAQLDIIQLQLTPEQKLKYRDGNATAWRMESSLREFPNIRPLDFWFDYPVHRVDTAGVLASAPAEGSALANLQKSSRRTSGLQRRERLDTAYEACNTGGPIRVNDMADFLHLTRQTVKRYLDEYPGAYLVDNGFVWKVQ